MKYTITTPKHIQKQIDKLPSNAKSRVNAKIQALANKPRPDGVIKLKSYSNQYRIRIGSYRVLHEIDDDRANITILQCRHRKDAYKDRN